MTTVQNRRDFLKVAAAAGAGVAMSSLSSFSQAREKKPIKPLERVRVGFVGIGMQGSGHVNNLLKIDGVDLVAVCDVRETRTKWAAEAAVAAGKKAPKVYTGDKDAYKRMCDTEDLDLVYTATPWELHVPIMVKAMKTGKHACTEVPAAVTLDECWEMVEVSEKTDGTAS
jgi:predicted dehydrogenase